MMMTIDDKDDVDESNIEHYGDVEVDDDICIIGAVCYENAFFPYSKDLVVSHVYSYIPYSKELAVAPVSRHIPYSKNLVVSMFLETFVFKGFGHFSCL